MKRTILAILGGLVTIDVLSLAGDAVTRKVAPSAFDADGLTHNLAVLLITMVYTILFCGLGGWAAARISRREDRRDVLILAGLQFLMTLAAVVMQYASSMLWYYATLLVLGTVAIVGGGFIANPIPAESGRSAEA